MAQPQVLNLYLPFQKRARLLAEPTIYGIANRAAIAAGWTVVLHNPHAEIAAEGHHLVYNRTVSGPDMLTSRRAYLEPFYRIEATNDRWNWDIALEPYDPEPGKDWFRRYWAKSVFGTTQSSANGTIFMPLQGKMSERRHFQAMSPLDMIAATLKADPNRDIVATLHPREDYAPEDLAALKGFGPRFHLMPDNSLTHLAACDYVVTQNSGLGFLGYFLRKPLILFAEIDFHHIAQNVRQIGLDQAFAQVLQSPPDFGAYLHWFLRQNAISLRSEDAVERFTARLRDHGWPL